ncbi:LysR family transcriptional regulator [Actinoplanes sp. NPDC051851]|uniref:LysR family transcriptional regulator n=1 Tax=Actinoplanes sp. NPDC051851 TaxID=3154753 RepID=UPI0034134D07
MRDLDVRRLRVLRELHQRGTVTAAAQALHLTPSAVSQQLAALSREAGVPLIEPTGRRVRLTGAARILLRHADEILARIELAQADIAASAGAPAGEVALGGFPATLTGLALPALWSLRSAAPLLTLRLSEAEPPEAFDLLLRGDLDIVLTVESPHGPVATDRRFHRSPVLIDPFDVALPEDHPLAAAPTLRLADLAGAEWILPHAGVCREICLAACVAAGFTPFVAHHIGDGESTMSAVALGLGPALVSRLAGVAPRPGVVIRALDGDRPVRHITAVLRRGSETAPHLAAVLDAIVKER